MKSAFTHFFLIGSLLIASVSLAAQVVITEFMASNGKTLADQDGDQSDWIEIHNGGNTAVNLNGWYLTDSLDLLAKWRFPGVSIAPNAFLVVFASGKNRAVVGSQLHTSFSLNTAGEYLALVEPDGTSVTSEFKPVFPEQATDVSYGTFQGANYYFSKPTPGTANGAGFAAIVANTKFSNARGFYDAPFNLTISSETANAVIRYTTNGTPPSATNGIVYVGPLSISGTTTVRAAAFKAGFLPSNADTQTYIFLNDVIRQSPTGQPPAGWPSSWGSNTRDYGMDPDVVNNPLYSATLTKDLKSIPTFSIVMDLKDLFDSTRGIYANPGQDGRDWERPASLELINPDGSKGFQINSGIRIRGGFSRSTGNPKHAFRFFFRDDYGEPRLKFPLFGDAGTDTFDALDLRTFQNYSWSFQGDSSGSSGVFLRDQFSRDTQLAMGHQGERGKFYHLYINGQYWGLYNTDERPEASFGATYFGGDKEDYDVIKVEAGPYTINATDGNMQAWTRLYNVAKAGFTTDDAYQKVQGNNPDGTHNPGYENLLDVSNLIDYMLVILYGGNLDAPISNFLGNTSPNNWYGLRNRNGPDGFRFFAHDSEHTLLNVNENRTGPYTSGDTSVLKSNPQWIWQKLAANREFRMLAADHIHRHFFNRGTLTPQATRERFLGRKAEIDRAVVGESARWGDAKRAAPYTRNVEWVNSVNSLLNSYFPRRSDIVLSQLKSKGLYPSVAAPAFNQHGGNINKGFSLSMTALAGTIYYTRDGSDPRLAGDAVSAGALAYNSPINLNESVHIKSRALSGGTWSALNEADFIVIQTFTGLLFTEIMYNPPGDPGADADEFEFIELKNVAGSSLDLSGVHFTSGITYTFPNGTTVGPGQFVLLVSNPAQFQKRYPGVRVNGAYTGRLENGGEVVTLVHAVGTPIVSVTYGDQPPWPSAADGGGFSLVPDNANLNLSPNDPANWRSSNRSGGSPGSDDPPRSLGAVWITEVLTHTDPPQLDAIELHNPTVTDVNIGNWFLTDKRSLPNKFRIPPGTIVPPGGYVVLTENDFNRNPGLDGSLTLSSHGEEVYIYSADPSGNLTGYSDGFSFGAAANGVSFGRHTLSTGEVEYPPQVANSLGTANAGPKIGPVVINEIYHQTAPGDVEFIELKNITGNPVKLYDPAYPTNGWRLNGVGFDFPRNIELSANGLLILAGGDPGLFRTKYGIPSDVPILGPFPGTLQDLGELLQLQRPDAPDVDINGVGFIPYIDVDAVRYNDKAPWPANAAGGTASLERLNARAYGNDPANWRSSPGQSSPGFENNGNRAPRVSVGPDLVVQSASFPAGTNLVGIVSDDGVPNLPGTLTIDWSQVSGPSQIFFGSTRQLSTTLGFASVGTYVIRLTANDGELEASDELTITVERVPSQSTLVAPGSVWKYLDNGSNQGTSWRGVAFNDSSWASGKAQLGYGDGDEATTVKFGPDSANKYPTTYFRRSFQVNNAVWITQLRLKLLRDDGAIAYLNGTEVFRSNMPEGNVNYLTWASANVAGADESTFYERMVDPSVLGEGNNVLAIELHQANGTSADVSLDLELMAVSVPLDDGLATWKTRYFNPAELKDSALSDDNADPDKDGHTNLQEFISGTNPRDAQSVLALKIAEQTAVGTKLRFGAVAGKTYTVQYRDSLLAGGAWFKVADVEAVSTSRTMEVTDGRSSNTSFRYYRIVTPKQP